MRYDQLSDEKLVDLIARRDAAAFDAFYERYARQALAVALLAGRDRVAAEAVVEQLFWSVWRGEIANDGQVRHHLMFGARQLARAHVPFPPGG
jgi:hypothetical protein